jgi:hypothetical protein
MSRGLTHFLVACTLAAALPCGDAFAQCILANPSFEFPGSAGTAFAGWNQLGSVGSSTHATHGAVAARVSGPDTGGWDVSALWQRLDSAPGERWSASGHVWHPAAKPLTGQSRAILNIEWRDAVGALIDFETHPIADASTPVDQLQVFTVASQPAPPGTAATHILLGVLQSPVDPVPDVLFDQVTFDSLDSPTLDDRQWLDFPGRRRLAFSSRIWRVKGPGFYEPGPSPFCDADSCVWLDGDGRLHLTIQDIGGTWHSTEVTLEEPLGYGDYIFTTIGRLENWHPNVVVGLFLWQYAHCYDPATSWWNPYNEIDVEFSRWGSPGNDVGQFVVQPFDFPGNTSRFDATFSDAERTSHAFRWLPDRIEFRSWRGGPEEEAPGSLMHAWTYAGPHIPRPEQPRVHINFWQFGTPPNARHEVVIDAFTFVPECSVPHCDPTDAQPPSFLTHLSNARPNPFNPRTTIRYSLAREVETQILIYDASGRLVRTLVQAIVPAGNHEVTWNGRNDWGDRAASGVYFYRLRAGAGAETKRMVLLR